MLRELRFEVMGSEATIGIVGGRAKHLDQARRQLEDRHRRWTRFDPDSEISRLNASRGRICIVSSDTFELITTAVDGWTLTQGRFDPTVLDAVRSIGYRSSWSPEQRWEPTRCSPAPGCGGIVLHPRINGVELPGGVGLDVGGVAKGVAADLAVESLLEWGAAGAIASIGGDIAVAGLSPRPGGWTIDVTPASRALGRDTIIRLNAGGVCTSSSAKRTWTTPRGPAHHVIDPATGTSSETPFAAATAVCRRAAGAEIAATAALVAGEGVGLFDELGVPGLIVGSGGQVASTTSFARLTAAPSGRVA